MTSAGAIMSMHFGKWPATCNHRFSDSSRGSPSPRGSVRSLHDGLITLDIPPFDRHVVLAAGGDYPEWSVFSGQFLHLRIPRFLQRRNVNVAFERSGCDPEAKSIVQPMSETVKVMIRRLVASVDQRTLAINQLDTGIFFVQ